MDSRKRQEEKNKKELLDEYLFEMDQQDGKDQGDIQKKRKFLSLRQIMITEMRQQKMMKKYPGYLEAFNKKKLNDQVFRLRSSFLSHDISRKKSREISD